MKNLGIRARERREELDLSQTEVGKSCGVSQQAIVHMEEGNLQRVPRYIDNLADALKTTKSWLLHGVEPKENIQYEQQTRIPGAFTDRVYTHADLEIIYKRTSPIERAKFDAIYPLIKKEMAIEIEEVDDSGFVPPQNGPKKTGHG